jgi:hypothetical protein
MPNTELANRLKEMNLSHPMITESCYTAVKASLANILMYAIDVFKLPERVFEYLLRYAKPFREEQREFPVILFLVRALSLFKHGFNHLRFLEFSYFPGFMGKIGYFLWKLKIIELNHHRLLKKYRRRALGPVWQARVTMTESENQFSLTRAAPSTSGRAENQIPIRNSPSPTHLQ